jgi:hypothetical protein
MSTEDRLAAKTRQQVDNAICWLEKRYFTEDARTKNRLDESAGHLVKGRPLLKSTKSNKI